MCGHRRVGQDTTLFNEPGLYEGRFGFLPTSPSVCPSVAGCLSLTLSLSRSLSPSVRSSFRMSVTPTICPSTCLSFVRSATAAYSSVMATTTTVMAAALRRGRYHTPFFFGDSRRGSASARPLPPPFSGTLAEVSALDPAIVIKCIRTQRRWWVSKV